MKKQDENKMLDRLTSYAIITICLLLLLTALVLLGII